MDGQKALEIPRAPGPYGAGPYILVSGVATFKVNEIIIKRQSYYFDLKKRLYSEVMTFIRI